MFTSYIYIYVLSLSIFVYIYILKSTNIFPVVNPTPLTLPPAKFFKNQCNTKINSYGYENNNSTSFMGKYFFERIFLKDSIYDVEHFEKIKDEQAEKKNNCDYFEHIEDPTSQNIL